MTDLSKYKSVPVSREEVTPRQVYHTRRDFLRAMGLLGATSLLAACAPPAQPDLPELAPIENDGKLSDELGETANTYEQITNYNNYYEFSTDKERVAQLAQDFVTSPWNVVVSGLVNKPKVYSIEDLLSKFTQQERIYRLRCVEAWSMVIPWQGFPLHELLDDVEPKPEAKYVKFTSALEESTMDGLRAGRYPWPYTEGLRLDEAMHDLAILATGLYGQSLPNQNGAPVRLVVPWKYGFKSLKSIIKIELTAEQPDTFWNLIASNEYGFYANVNPEVDHPRWSQASERRIGEVGRRETLMFNGYAEQVAHLYEGMDLRANY